MTPMHLRGCAQIRIRVHSFAFIHGRSRANVFVSKNARTQDACVHANKEMLVCGRTQCAYVNRCQFMYERARGDLEPRRNR
eukprot:3576298-Pleurochrysis_carterae.AAC.4